MRTIRIADCAITTEYWLACLAERRRSRSIAAFLEAVLG
jgi:hypothetical protein